MVACSPSKRQSQTLSEAKLRTRWHCATGCAQSQSSARSQRHLVVAAPFRPLWRQIARETHSSKQNNSKSVAKPEQSCLFFCQLKVRATLFENCFFHLFATSSPANHLHSLLKCSLARSLHPPLGAAPFKAFKRKTKDRRRSESFGATDPRLHDVLSSKFVCYCCAFQWSQSPIGLLELTRPKRTLFSFAAQKWRNIAISTPNLTASVSHWRQISARLCWTCGRPRESQQLDNF